MKKLRISAFDVINIFVLCVLCFVFIMPLVTVVSSSLISIRESARRGSYVVIPEVIDITAYKLLLRRTSNIYRAYGVTIMRVLAGTFANLLFTSTLAYGLSKRKLPGLGFFTSFCFLTMLFSGGLIPTYIVVRMTGVTNTFWAMIVPSLVGVWNLLIMRTFFWQIPESLSESAEIDGASEWRVFLRIFLPLSVPSLVTVGMFYAVGHWNAWFDAAIYINRWDLKPLQIILRDMVSNMAQTDVMMQGTDVTLIPDATLRCATIVVSTVPILCIYPFLQKYFIKGAMVGAVKG